MTRFTYRTLLLVTGASLLAAGGLGLACSSNNGGGFGDVDATPDGTTNVDGAADAPPSDSAQGTDAGGGDAGGNCSKVTGLCDIVLQNCPDGPKGEKQECTVTSAGAGFTTACSPVQATQQLPTGRACCPSTSSNPCLPGLECIGDDCVDGSAPTARCTPHCCPGDNAACGQSDPEGIAGACDLTISISGQDVFSACTYKERCQPFGIEKCLKSTEVCIVDDKFGTSSCIFTVDGGAAENQPCQYKNSCADGLMCFGSADAGGSCQILCHIPGTVTPFDAGAIDGGPGHGGCPGGETCKYTLPATDFPAWLGLCGT